MLCSSCTSFLQSALERYPRRDQELVVNLSTLAATIRENCYLCKAIAKGMDCSVRDLSKTKPDDPKVSCVIQPRRIISTISRANGASNPQRCSALARCVPISRDGRRIREVRDCSMKEEDTLDQTGRWYTLCYDRHTSCGMGRDADYVPPRLIEINRDYVKLIETAESSRLKDYATLSYCWGSNPSHLTLSDQSWSQLHNGVEFSELPKTFRDAITVVKRLNIKYLWIDALCVLQNGKGSLEDWQEHVLLMSSIYSNCLINIAATDACNADGGLFFARDTKHDEPCVVKLIDGQPSSDDPGIDEYVLIEHDLWRRTIINSPLNSRAWVFQERLLAPRTVHFGKEELFWECTELQPVSGTLPDKPFIFDWEWDARDWASHRPFTLGLELGHHTVQHMVETFLDPQTSKSTYGIYEQIWSFHVQAYSSMQLTNSGDKLPAIAGIAQRMAAAMDDEYFAGHFRKSLPCSLLWWPSEENQVHKYRAPSWSWASVDGQINMYHRNKASINPSTNPLNNSLNVRYGSDKSTVKHLAITLVDDKNPFGEIITGSMTLHGPAWKVVHMPNTPGDEIQITHNDLQLGVKITVKGMDKSLLSIPDLEFYLLAITVEHYKRARHDTIPEEWDCVHGLVLRRTTDKSVVEHVRVGLWESKAFSEFISSAGSVDVTIV